MTASPIGDFTTRLLARHGALLELDASAILAVVPPALASALDVREYQRFTFDRQASGDPGMPVDYDSPFVERCARLVESLGRIACVAAPPLTLKPIDPSVAITAALTFTNGIVRDCRSENGQAQYMGFFIQHDLLADESVSGMTEVWVNTTTGSAPRLTGLAGALLLAPGGDASDIQASADHWQDVLSTATDGWKRASALARFEVADRLRDAMESLRRRRDRDFRRLQDYYETIDADIRRRARRALAKRDAAAAATEVSRLEATARAYRARLDDLVDRYRARVRLRPLGALVCTLPIHHVTARFHRRSASRTVALAWNPIDCAIEPPCCEGCGIGTTTIVLCDDRVHIVCGACHEPCATCGRPYCRACHSRCPRRHEPGGGK